MKVVEQVKKAGKPLAHFGVGVAGLTAGNLVLSKIPDLGFLDKVPVVGQYLKAVAPGAALMFIAYMADKKIKNEFVKTGAFTLGIVGFTNAVKKLLATAPADSALQKIADYLPTGLGGVSQGHPANSGHYPPEFWTDSNKAYDRVPQSVLNGVGSAYSLEGPGSAYSLEGPGRSAYSLEGNRFQ